MMQSISNFFFNYQKVIIIISILSTVLLKKNINVIYFIVLFLFIPSVIDYFLFQLKFKDLLSKYNSSITNIDLGIKTLEKSNNAEIEEMRQKLAFKAKLVFFAFFYIIGLLLLMMFLF
ncbi:hypothetical protein [Flavobacterium cerinum]|uniref:DUF3899 domain-containing protein n=1 Tax=Flavobacterium cerinum TaxID=2502784 RepID=A0ABY5IUL4_9FLAO|nr:hypothetical protein [Flavobacterium cerinum]UUC46494.1 hypothetical protein NOX80_04660 [Flavobacterium cerinum]